MPEALACNLCTFKKPGNPLLDAFQSSKKFCLFPFLVKNTCFKTQVFPQFTPFLQPSSKNLHCHFLCSAMNALQPEWKNSCLILVIGPQEFSSIVCSTSKWASGMASYVVLVFNREEPMVGLRGHYNDSKAPTLGKRGLLLHLE